MPGWQARPDFLLVGWRTEDALSRVTLIGSTQLSEVQTDAEYVQGHAVLNLRAGLNRYVVTTGDDYGQATERLLESDEFWAGLRSPSA